MRNTLLLKFLSFSLYVANSFVRNLFETEDFKLKDYLFNLPNKEKLLSNYSNDEKIEKDITEEL